VGDTPSQATRSGEDRCALIWLPVAGFLLVARATAAFAAPTVVDTAGETLAAPIVRAGAFLQDVLDQLVDEGVIDQGQSDAIIDRVDEKVAERRAETVGFERARGIRRVHEVAGGFSISVSKTVAVPLDELFRAFADRQSRERWLPRVPLGERKLRPGHSARFDWRPTARGWRCSSRTGALAGHRSPSSTRSCPMAERQRR